MSTIENSAIPASVEVPPQLKLAELLRTAWIPHAISLVAELRVADVLKEGAKSCKEIAEATSTHEDNLYRVLRAVATIGLFREVEYRVFENTPLSDVLREDAEGSVREGALSVGYPYHWTAFGHMERSVKTGETAFDSAYGLPIFEYFAQNPLYGDNFNKVMISLSDAMIWSIMQSYDFSQYQSLVDVGGGYGSVIIPLTKTFPHLKGILFDMPHVVEGAKPYVEAAG
ncbi:MAG: methyltransferase, partial [Tumebacillaceae bacterium]